MSDFTANTPTEIQQMLSSIGVKGIDELFSVIQPGQRPASFALPEGRSEFEVLERLKNLAGKNAGRLTCFLGAGYYDHYIPSVVDHLSSRSEFYTAYTPYQPECSQGTLQAIYEYQSAVCRLTGMEVANASLYDGGTALYEALLMAQRITGRSRVVVDGAVNPIYRSILSTYSKNLAIEIIEVPCREGLCERAQLKKHLDETVSCIILQNPNFFGAIDNHQDLIQEAHRIGALAIESVYPIALGLLSTPAEMGADIVVGEGQSLGMPLGFGGPYLGFMAAKAEFSRKMPGRIVGETTDARGRRGFVLTLQTREQHIRRQKATSNICSNEALCALRALIYLSSLGKEGLREVSRSNYEKSEFAKGLLKNIKGVSVKGNAPTFNEFCISLPRDPLEVCGRMIEKGFAAGLPLGPYYPDHKDCLLVTVTEKRAKEEIIHYAECLESIL